MKRFKPTTPSLRHTVLLDKKKESVSKNSFSLKTCSLKYKPHTGRNNRGIITVRGRQRGHKKKIKSIHFVPEHFTGIVETIEYSSNHSSNLARVSRTDVNKRFYIIAPQNLHPGMLLKSSLLSTYSTGNFLQVSQVPLGNIGFHLHQGKFRVASAAGCFIRILRKGRQYSLVKLPSGEERLVVSSTILISGKASNSNQNKVVLGKAGRNRWLGNRPTVRGVAKNPIDHPHGGGEGKTSGGRPSVSPWSKPAHNSPTSKSRNRLIIKSRKKKVNH